MGVDAVNLKDIFRQIQANASDLHDTSPSMRLTANRNPRREGGVHTIGAPSSRVWLRLCERIGCGHVFGLLARETNVPLALMLVRMALRPISKTRSLWRLPFSRASEPFRWFTSLRRRPRCGSPCGETSFLLSLLVQAATARSS
jgi:hypothetical protein